jgi:hypothetical protein
MLDRRQNSHAKFDIPPARPTCCLQPRTAQVANAGKRLWLSQKCGSPGVRQRIDFQIHPTAESGKLVEVCLAKISRLAMLSLGATVLCRAVPATSAPSEASPWYLESGRSGMSDTTVNCDHVLTTLLQHHAPPLDQRLKAREPLQTSLRPPSPTSDDSQGAQSLDGMKALPVRVSVTLTLLDNNLPGS